MENSEETIDKLFYELASETRVSILRELNKKSWKMNSLARKLDLTTTETFRQLQRLTEALLVQKQPDGKYTISPYGALVLELSSSLDFVFKNKQYFLAHTVQNLPKQFINRIGELSKSTLLMGMIESTTNSSKLIGEAQQFMWGISPEPLKDSAEVLSQQIPKGVNYRIISPQPPTKLSNLEIRNHNEVPLILVVTEKEASLSFRFIEGRVDYASFSGTDPMFLNWIKDLFLYYWDQAERK
ncbi:MAG: helix-turn-helix transcriptional regulator [archaeon]|nr:DUF1724 domain-containing protein [Candidatus Bathyarchaeum sp.]